MTHGSQAIKLCLSDILLGSKLAYGALLQCTERDATVYPGASRVCCTYTSSLQFTCIFTLLSNGKCVSVSSVH